MEQQMKICSKCHKELSISMFYKRKDSKDGYYGVCKNCQRPSEEKLEEINKRRRERYQMHQDEINKKRRERYANDSEYREKIINDAAEYRKNHRSELCESAMKYYYEHFEEIKRRKRLYIEAHKEDMKQWQRQYRAQNQDELNAKHREYWKRYYIENKYQILNKNRLSKEKRSLAEGVLTQEQIDECIKFFDNLCAYSGQPFDDEPINNLTLDHIIPLVHNGTNYIWNVVPARRTCNSSKGSKEMSIWYLNQSFYSEERLQKILEWQEYAYNKWGCSDIAS